nr:hypothetical protein [uncultured Desulfobacter sp.]
MPVYFMNTLSFNAKLAIIEMGASLAVPTVRYKFQRTGRNLNSTLIRINPRNYHVCRLAPGKA